MPDNPDLLPCPFCGQMPNTCLYDGDTGIQISCENLHCGVYPKSIGEIALAIAAWNTRADRWIPVSERLPDRVGDYLVRISDELRPNRSIKILPYFPSQGWMSESKQFPVTHWIPLPALPKEVEG